jgi:hypothetical protein
MVIPLDLNIVEAYDFYKKYLLGTAKDKAEIYERYGFRPPEVASKDWEVFGAILLRDRKKPGIGADLERHEVKSAGYGWSFEYQYHRNHGEEKLDEDKEVNHLFISYAENYQDVEVRYVLGQDLALTFESWRPGLVAKYQSGGQRYRKSISFGFVRQHGTLILRIEQGELAAPPPATDSEY